MSLNFGTTGHLPGGAFCLRALMCVCPERMLCCTAGCLHPDHTGFFDSPAEYLRWYRQHGPVQDAAAPTVAVLLYRKHVITQQLYIEQLVSCLEAKGIRPVPIFINGTATALGSQHPALRQEATWFDMHAC